MVCNEWRVVLAGLTFVMACGDEGATKPGSEPDYADQEITLSTDLLIPAGKTVRVGPGAIFHAAANVQIRVLGQLLVEGSAQAPAQFLGGGTPRSWHGIVIEAGGKLQLGHAKISDATYGMHALPGSEFAVENSTLGGSFKAAVVQSEGSFVNTRFEAAPATSISLADEVSLDDPNGTLTIMDASPTVSNCQFDGATGYTDMVRIGGESSPTFDHVYLHNAHCGFHTSGGINNSPHITNAVFENLAYGIMAYTTKPIIEDSVFRMNSNDVGICTGASEDNTPVLRNNSYQGGAPHVDASCFRIGTDDASPAAEPNATAGVSGL